MSGESREKLEKDQILSDLLRKRVVYIDGSICGDMARDVGLAITWLNEKSPTVPITIYIDSSGGETVAGLHIYDAIRSSRAPTAGIVYRRANSAASIILQGCTKRQIMRNAGVLIHYMWIPETQLNILEDDPEKVLQRARHLQRRFNEVYKERTGKSIAEIEGLLRAEKLMTAEEALAFGLVDEII